MGPASSLACPSHQHRRRSRAINDLIFALALDELEIDIEVCMQRLERMLRVLLSPYEA
jgi:hypothetical protein